MSGFGRKFNREAVRAEKQRKLALRREINRNNDKIREQHRAELAALPDGWTTVELDGKIVQPPTIANKHHRKPKGPRRMGQAY